MGLDGVELVMSYEEAFGIEIPDSEAARMRTPREVVDFLLIQLGEASGRRRICLSARAFYQLRAELVAYGHGRRTITPAASVVELLGPDAHDSWSQIQRKLGCDHWPRLKSRNRVLGWLGGIETLGEAAGEIGMMNPRHLHPEPWTRAELEATLMQITELELGLESGKFTVDSRYVEDMRID